MHHKCIGGGLIVVAALALAGCSAAGTGPADNDTIRMSIGTDPTSFDPALGRAVDDYTVDRLLFDTLLRKDDDGALVGGLATGWESTGAADYTFTIRDDATCADGSAITPSLVAASLSRVLDPETGSSARSLIVGTGEATVTADDQAGTVSVTLSVPWSDFLVGLTVPQTGVVCQAGLDDLEGLAAGTVEGAFSGPYTLTSAQAAVGYDLTLREDYDAWPEFSTALTGRAAQTITLTPIAEQSTIATQLLSGGLDVAPLSDESVSRVESQDGFTLTTSTSATAYLLFNQRAGTLFADAPELRTAVAQLVDRAAFNDLLSQSRGEGLISVASPNTACVLADAGSLVAHDPDAAAATLAGARIRLVGSTGFASAIDYLAEILRGAGATVDLQILDNANWSTTTTGGGSDWDLTLQVDLNVVGTATSSLLRVMGPATEDGGRNKSGEVNEAGYAALSEALAVTDEDARCVAFAEAQQIMLEDVDAVPLTSMPTVTVAADGFSIRTFGDYVDVATLRIEA